MSKNSYRFDKWMVKFLIAHALAMEDKSDDAADVNMDREADDVLSVAPLERSRITHTMFQDLQNIDGAFSTFARDAV